MKVRSANTIKPAFASSEKHVGRDMKAKYVKKIMITKAVDVPLDILKYVEAIKEKEHAGLKMTVHTHIKMTKKIPGKSKGK